MQTRSAYIVDRDVDFFIVRRLVKKVQIKLVRVQFYLLAQDAEPAQKVLVAAAAAVGGFYLLLQGIGTVPGVVIGSIILQAINYGLYFLGVNAYLQYIIRGAIIIIAVAIDVQKYVAKK